jgi:hypothetical protein
VTKADIAAIIATAKATERQRIIKLIEPQVALHREQGLDASADYLMHLIELINNQ